MNLKIKKEHKILAVIILVAVFLRFYKLGEVPAGLYQDETAIAYNAHSLLETGADEYGRFMPLYFQSFGDFKLPVYIYTTVPAIAAFGMSSFSVRLPSALFGVFSVGMMYFFTRTLIRSKGRHSSSITDRGTAIALLASGLLAINPWHLHYSRATFEVSIGLFLFISGAYFLLLWFRNKTPGAFIIGTVAYILAMYSYNLTRLLSPILYIWCVWWFAKKYGQVSKKGRKNRLVQTEYIATIVLSGLMLIPMAVTIFAEGGASSAAGTLIFSSAAVSAPQLEFRSYLVDLPGIFTRISFNQYVSTAWQYIKNIISYLSVDFFFLHGSSHGNHGIGNFGQFYHFDLLLIPLGMAGMYLKMRRLFILFLGWVIAVIAVSALTREAPHATRSFFMLVSTSIFSAVGAVLFYDWSIASIHTRKYARIALSIILVGISVYSGLVYFVSYYFYFPVAYASSWRYADKEASTYIADHLSEYDLVGIDPSAGFIYTSYLFYTGYPPKAFQDTAVRLPPDSEGFTRILKFDGIVYASRLQLDALSGMRILYLTSEENMRSSDREVYRVYYPNRPVVVNIGQEIIAYPVEETAYVFVSVSP